METIQVLPIRVRVTADLRKALQQRDREHEALSIQEHRQILEWIHEGREKQARAAMEAHISRSMGNILFRFRRSRKTAGEENVK